MPSQTGSIDLTAQVLANNNAKDYSDNVVDNLEIGGRNLLGNTSYLVEGTEYTGKATAAWAGLLPASQITLLEEITQLDEQYTLSFDARVSSAAIRVQWRFNYVSTSGTYKEFSNTPTRLIDSTDWARYYITLKTPNTRPDDYARSAIIMQSQSGSTTDYVEVRRFKLEHGTKATDWIPAPEDQEALITSTRNWYATCDTAAGTVAKTATTTDEGFELREGVVVDVKFANTNSGAVGSLTLNVNDTGAKSIKTMYNNSLANLTTAGQLYAGLVVRFVYSGTYWIAATNYNSDTVDRKRINNAVIVAENVTAYAICGRSGTGHKKLVSGLAIDISYPIAYLYAGNISGQSYAVASGGTTTSFYTSIPGVNLQSTKASWTGTQYAMCYIKGTLSGTTFTVHSDVFTTTVPTSDDGFAYIPIGIMVSTTQVSFDCDNTVYMYRNGSFHKADTVSNYISADSTGIRIASASPSTQNQRLELTSSTLKMYDASNYQRLKLDSTNGVIIGKESYGHTQVTDTGLFIYDVNNKKRAQVDNNGLSVYLSDGTTSIANFGEVTRIGKAYDANANDNESHMELDYHSMQLINKNNSTYFYVSDLRGSDGTASITETFTGDGTTKSFSLAIEAVNTTYTVTVSDSSGGSVTKSTLRITFQTAPTSGAVITATYSTNNTKAVAFTFGLREIGSFVGPVSTSEGWGTRATALCSHAEGYATKATKRYSHAEGFDTEASGEQSHAEGYDCTASGFSAHAEGQSSEAIKSCAHAEGTQTHASGLSSHAEGKTTSASGEASHSEGFGTSATQAYSHAEGNQTKAKMGSSHAEGLYSIANGYTSHAEGYSTTTNGEAAHAEGRGTTADGNYSHAEGYLTTAGPYAHAEGWSTNASGQYSHTEGYETTASSYGSHAEGVGSSATGYYTHAQNHGTVAVKNSQTAIGKYNEEDTSSGEYGTHALIIGNGTADDARSNALAVNWNGTIESGIARYGATTWLDILKGNAALYVPKDPDAMSNPIGALVMETAAGGAWVLSNYNDEGFRLVYMTAENRAGGTNTATMPVKINADGSIVTSRDINTTSTSGIFTAGSGITVAVFKFCQRGNVAAFYIGVSKSTATAANTVITVGTVAAGRRPPFECAGPGTSGVGDAYINENGVISFRSTSQIAANARFYARVTYPVV